MSTVCFKALPLQEITKIIFILCFAPKWTRANSNIHRARRRHARCVCSACYHRHHSLIRRARRSSRSHPATLARPPSSSCTTPPKPSCFTSSTVPRHPLPPPRHSVLYHGLRAPHPARNTATPDAAPIPSQHRRRHLCRSVLSYHRSENSGLSQSES